MSRRNSPVVDQQALRILIETSGVHFRNGPQSYVFTCPKCAKKDRLYLRKVDGRFKCMRCGPDFQGWADWALAEILGKNREEIRGLIYGEHAPAGTGGFSVELADHWGEFESDEEVDVGPADLPEIMWSPDIVDLDSKAGAKGLAYLAGRGISLELAQHYGLRFCPADQRVIFPVVLQGKLVGWQSRYIGKTDWLDEETLTWHSIPKMLTMGQIGGKCLMFQDNLKGGHAVMVEGPIDAIKAHLCGCNVATMGKGVSRRQLDIVAASNIQKLYIGLDPDAAEDIMRILRDLTAMDIKCFRLDPPPGCEDIGAATPEAVLDSFRSAAPMVSGQIFVHFTKDW